MIIVISGTDASGKKTQSKLLVKHLNKIGKISEYLGFPDYNAFFGKMIGNYLNGEYGDVHKISPYLSSILYAGDRWQHTKMLNKSENKIIVCDRYSESNIAHQAIKLPVDEQDKFISWLEYLEFSVFKIPKPNLTFFLYVPYAFSKKLIKNRRQKDYIKNGNIDQHEISKDHQLKAEAMYLTLSKREDWHLINCVEDNKLLSIEDIHKKIVDIVKNII